MRPGPLTGAMVPVLPLQGFEERLRGLDRAVVAFVADWCGYCARFAPLLEQAAAVHPGRVFAADISDDEGDPRWDRYTIEVVPSVLAFQRGAAVARLDGVLGRGIKPADFDAFVRARA